MTGPTKVVVFRHGEASYADPGRFDDAVGGRLSPDGRRQAAGVADRWADAAVTAVWASPRGRAVETARLLAAPHGLPVQSDARLREFDLGAWNGADIAATWSAVETVTARWMRGELAGGCPGAEVGAVVAARVASAVREIAAGTPQGVALVVSHGTAMTVGLPGLGGSPDTEWAAEVGLPHVAAVVLEVTGGRWRCRSWAGQVPPVS